MSTSLSLAVKRVAALKGLVIAGAVVAGVAMTAGTSYTSKSAQDAAHRMRTFALSSAAETASDTRKILVHGLRAIAELDVSRLDPVTAAGTVRTMAAQTVKDAVFLEKLPDYLQEPYVRLVADGAKSADTSLESLLRTDAAFQKSIATTILDPSAIDEETVLKLKLDKSALRTSYADVTLSRIAKASTATPGAMQAVARKALAKLGEASPVVDHASVAERLESSVKAKLSALANIEASVADAQAIPDGPSDMVMSAIGNSADEGRMDIPAADRISLRAVADHYATHPEEAGDAKRAVSASLQAGMLDAALERISSVAERGGDDALSQVTSLAATSKAQVAMLDRRFEMHADAGETAAPRR